MVDRSRSTNKSLISEPD